MVKAIVIIFLFAFIALTQSKATEKAPTYKYVKQLIIDHEVQKVKEAIKNGYKVNTFGCKKTALHVAVKSDSPTIVELLLDNGADINAATKNKKETPLMYAARYNRLTIAKILTTRNADRNLKDKKGRTAKDMAKEKGNYKNLLSVL